MTLVPDGENMVANESCGVIKRWRGMFADKFNSGASIPKDQDTDISPIWLA